MEVLKSDLFELMTVLALPAEWQSVLRELFSRFDAICNHPKGAITDNYEASKFAHLITEELKALALVANKISSPSIHAEFMRILNELGVALEEQVAEVGKNVTDNILSYKF